MKFPTLKRNVSRPQMGLGIMYPSVGVVERIGPDWDWIWIDAQHGDLDFREVVDLVRACHLIDRPALVRVPGHDAGWVGKALDAGAAGIIIPMVETLEEAKAMVRAAKFPALGNRSYGGRRVIDFLGRSYYESANRDTALIIQVESSGACDIADELAAIEGVDGLFLGPDDLLIREGLHVDAPKDHSTIGRQLEMVSTACRDHQKLSVCIGVSDSAMKMAKDFGYHLVVGGSDVGFIVQGSIAASAKSRAFFGEAADPAESPKISSLY